ncbi:MAG: DUF1572 family protein [Planctomycetota bacterium]
MSMLPAVRIEFARYRRMVELAVEQVDDADLPRRLDPDGNSIAILLGHLSGNLRSRFTEFLTSDGEKPWRRRDAEFEEHGRTRGELLAEWAEGWRCVDDALAAVEAAGDGVFARGVVIRGVALSVGEALLRSVAHVATHAGQIVLLARHWAGDRWRTLSIPRGGSGAYAANPTLEKGHGPAAER